MYQKPDLDKIKVAYELGYKKAISSGRKAMETYIEDWQTILNGPHKNIFNECRSIGVPLHPYYPINGKFVHMGNPFYKVGIEVIYKGEDAKDKRLRWAAFQLAGWTIYHIKGSDTYCDIETLYERVKADYGNWSNFYEIGDEGDYDKFITDHKGTNSECLLYHIRNKHFQSEFTDNRNDVYDLWENQDHKHR